MPLRLLSFSPINSGALRGRAKILYGSLEIDGVSLFEQGDKRWCQLPSEPVRGDDGAVIKNERGKPLYRSPLKWRSWAVQQEFSAEVWALVESSLGSTPAAASPPPRAVPAPRPSPRSAAGRRANHYAAPRLPMRQPADGGRPFDDPVDDIGG